MVGDVADGINGFLRGTGRHKQADAFHVFLVFDRLARPVQNLLRLRHFSGAHVAAGQPAGSGLGHGVAVFAKQGQVILRDGGFPHPRIHGREHDLRALAGQHRGGEHIVCNAVRQFRQNVGCCRCNHTEIRLFGQRHMLHLKLKIAVKRIHGALVAGERFKRDRVDKIDGVRRHDHMHITAELDKPAHHVGSLVGGNAAADTEQDCFSLHHGCSLPSSPREFCPGFVMFPV